MNSVIGPDAFGAAIAELMDGVDHVSVQALNKGVREGAKESAKEWRQNARGAVGGTGKYAASIRSRMDSSGDTPEAHAYSLMPGLPHLLEKGHAKMGGGRVAGRVHIAPAAEGGFKKTIEVTEKAIDAGLGAL